MSVRSSHIITLPSGNVARDFRWESLGYGRVRVHYVYTDRRRHHQVARRFTAEFLNGKVDIIIARSAKGGRVECFKSSSIINELLEMLAEFYKFERGITKFYRDEPAKVEVVEPEQHAEGSKRMDTLMMLVMTISINLMVTLFTIGIVYNL